MIKRISATEQVFLREQADILQQHLTGDEVDIAFVRIHALIIFQAVAKRSEVVQLLRNMGGTPKAVLEVKSIAELASAEFH